MGFGSGVSAGAAGGVAGFCAGSEVAADAATGCGVACDETEGPSLPGSDARDGGGAVEPSETARHEQATKKAINAGLLLLHADPIRRALNNTHLRGSGYASLPEISAGWV